MVKFKKGDSVRVLDTPDARDYQKRWHVPEAFVVTGVSYVSAQEPYVVWAHPLPRPCPGMLFTRIMMDEGPW